MKYMVLRRSVCFAFLLYFVHYSEAQKLLYSAPWGVQAYTFRKSFPVDVSGTLDTIRRMGFTEIEGTGGRVPPAEFRKLCEARGMLIPSMGVSYEFLNKYPDSLAWMAKQLGSSYVMCAWIPHKNGIFTYKDAVKAVDDFNRIGKYLKKQGIIFCYHAHGYEFQPYENETLLDYIIKNTNPEYVSFEMDIFWIQFGGGDPVTLLKKYGSRWKLLHLKDMRKGTKKDLTGLTGPENDVPLGTGELNIPAILKEANEIGIKHFFIEDESNYVNEQVTQSIAYLKSLKE
jgi:sugar phosphate isomerase/epimerase